MTSDPKGSSSPGIANPRRKRPAVTIEVKATEVTETPAPAAGAATNEPAAAQGAPAAPPADAPAESLEATAADAELAAAPALDREASGAPPEAAVPPPPPPSPDGERPAAVARDWTVLGVAGALLVLLIIAGLWLAGAFERSEDAQLEKRLARMESQLLQLADQNAAAPARPAEDSTLARAAQRLDDIDGRIARLETTPPPAAPDAGLAERLGALDAAIKNLTRRVAEPKPGSDAEMKVLSDRLAALEATTKALTARVAEDAGRVDQVAAQAQAAGAQATAASEQAEQNRSLRTMRPALLAATLRDAVARGDAYAPELAELKSLLPQTQLAPLDTFATTGVPTATALGRELAGLVPGLRARVARAEAPPAGAGVLERLQASAARLVRIRPIDEPTGDDAAAVLARLEASAARGDLNAVLADLAKLPPDVRAPAEAWVKKAEARNAALDTAQRVARDTAAAVGKE